MDKRKIFFNLKSLDQEAKTATAYVSTYTWDRMRERFAKGAWRLDNFKKNPVVLWAHKSDELPIAKATQVQEDDFGLLASMQFDTENEFAMQVFSLLARGFLNTFSVGFVPSKFVIEPIDGENRGYVWTDAELLEFSVVPVPANAGAVVVREDEALVKKIFGDDILEKKDVLESGEYVFRMKGLDLPEQKPFDPDADFKVALKEISNIAKSRSGKSFDESSLALIKSSMTILNEIITENVNGVSKEEFLELKSIVEGLGTFVKNHNPDYKTVISKILMQIEVSVRKGNR